MNPLRSIDEQAAQWALILRDPFADPVDIREAMKWIDESPERQEAFEKIQRFFDALNGIVDTTDLLNNITSTNSSKKNWRHPLALVACIALLLVTTLSVLLGVYGWNPLKYNIVESISVTSQSGELKTIVLADNSNILLSGASEITVDFTDRERRVELNKGEAFFNVAPDPKRRFIVRAGIGTATVLGTQFGVRRKAAGAIITVVEGRVAVTSRGAHGESRVILTSAMQATYDDDMVLALSNVDLNNVLAWRTGKLVFTGESLYAVVEELNRYSSVPVEIMDSGIMSIPVTGVVRIDRIYEWLKGLETIIPLSVTQTDASIRLKRSSIEKSR